MKYKIIWQDPHSKYLSISATFAGIDSQQQEVRLPAWRPGRYEIQNFAQYIGNVQAFNPTGDRLALKKINKDSWLVNTNGAKELELRYNFYADMQNAGGSFVENQFFYLNPVNCLMYLPEQLDEACKLEIEFEHNQIVACGMPHHKQGNTVDFWAESFHELVDSPLMLSNVMQHRIYEVYQYKFHVWVKGRAEVDWDRLLPDFKDFTKEQIDIFGEFPSPEYHFMLWIMPQAIHHGVEHSNSTMMTLGPDSQSFDAYYHELLGLASHELFHAWNVKRIRPKELLPYDYSKEMYFETCFVVEGLTTLYGDWVLYRSGVWDKQHYMSELETTLKRHFEAADDASESLRASSFDLWLDGYRKSVPNRTVSVYHKGAIAGLILNNLILVYSNAENNLDDLMRLLWKQFGKPFEGYSLEDYIACCEAVCKRTLNTYFQDIISGNFSIWQATNEALNSLGFTLQKTSEGYVQLAETSPSISLNSGV